MIQYLGWIVSLFVLVTNVIILVMTRRNMKLQRAVDSLQIRLDIAETNLKLAQHATEITNELLGDYAVTEEQKSKELSEIPTESQELSDEEKLAAIATGAGRSK